MKKSKKAQMHRDPNEVIFIGLPQKAFSVGVEPHNRSSSLVSGKATQSLESLKSEWKIINDQIQKLLESTTTESKGFALEELTFSLGISAEGSIGFIVGGKLSGEASIELTFKRKS
jgi:hypothetical protein